MTETPLADVPAKHINPIALCENKLASSDLAQYYSLLFAPRPQREALFSLYAFWQEIREIPDECRDTQVAHTKLAWWHEEIHELFSEKPRHPVAIALLSAVNAHKLSPQPFLDIIEAVAAHLGRTNYATHQELLLHGITGRGAIERLAAQIMHLENAQAVDKAVELGARLELTELLRDIPLHRRRERLLVPQEDMARFEVRAEDMRDEQLNQAVKKLLIFEAERLYNEITLQLSSTNRAPLITLQTRAEIALAILRKIQKNADNLIRQRPTLSPLRQLWIVWRSARKFQSHNDR